MGKLHKHEPEIYWVVQLLGLSFGLFMCRLFYTFNNLYHMQQLICFFQLYRKYCIKICFDISYKKKKRCFSCVLKDINFFSHTDLFLDMEPIYMYQCDNFSNAYKKSKEMFCRKKVCVYTICMWPRYRFQCHILSFLNKKWKSLRINCIVWV